MNLCSNNWMIPLANLLLLFIYSEEKLTSNQTPLHRYYN